jgi:glycosyltransferase involved in cell wall biosynthesis
MLARSVGGAARKAGLRRPVLWTSLPSAVDAIGAVGESAVVYYCGDDFGALAGVDHKAARNMETELAGRADLILAASPMLAARFPAHKTHLLEHGVDHALFSTPVACAEELSRNAPTAGFYGAIAPWMDVDLIAATARLLPNWNFIFVGPEQTDVSALRACPNVALFGPRPHGELPRFSQHWTAGIIPFRDNAQIRASNPLKLREYLAAGRPIVTTDFPALAPYRAHVTIANTPERFAAALEASMSDMPDAAQRRRASVAGESWSARAALAADLIDRLAR